MKKAILLAIISLFLLNIFLYADSNNFDSLIKTLAESNNHAEQIKIIKSVDNVKNFSKEEQDRLRKAFLEMTVNAENTIDPGLNAALLIEAVRLFPEDLRLSVKLAKSHAELGQYKDSLDVEFKILTQSGGKNSDYEFTTVGYATQGLGIMMTKNGKLAYKQFKTVIKRDPKWTGGYFLMGAYYFRVKDFKNATKYFRKCQELNPKHQGAANLLVMIKKKEKK